MSRVFAGNSADCAVRTDGTAACWGVYPPNARSASIEPKEVTQLSDMDALVPTLGVSPLLPRACSLRRSGLVSCFDPGALAPSDQLDVSPATAIDGSVGDGHYCAVSRGTVGCWGDDSFLVKSNPGVSISGWNQVLPVPGLAQVTQVAVGDSHACALARDRVTCWGDNSKGQLGIGSQQREEYFPPTEIQGLRALAIDAGSSTTCAILEDHTLRCWGQLGPQRMAAPLEIPGLSAVRSVSVGSNSACVVEMDHTAWCFGDNEYGQLGNPSAIDSSPEDEELGPVRVLDPELPPPVPDPFDGGPADSGSEPDADLPPSPPPRILNALWTEVAVGRDYACGLLLQQREGVRRLERRVLCWGSLLVEDGSGPKDVPIQVPDSSDVRQLVAGPRTACVIFSDDTASCWGEQPDGTAWSALPRQLDQFADIDQLVPTSGRACALLRDRTVSCFDSIDRSSRTVPDLDGIVELQGTIGSGHHYCALQATPGAISCWGDDNFILRDHPGVSFADNQWMQPFTVPDLQGMKQVAVGDDHTCTLTTDQEVLCWGDNSNGQIGVGAEDAGPFPPTPVLDLPPVLGVRAHGATTCAILEDRTLQCWGLIGHTRFSSPHAIPGLSDVATVSVGSSSICAQARLEPTVWCFGDNEFGQLGIPTAGDPLTPTGGFLGPVELPLPEPPPN